jgi:hypothetical protein
LALAALVLGTGSLLRDKKFTPPPVGPDEPEDNV